MYGQKVMLKRYWQSYQLNKKLSIQIVNKNKFIT